MRSRTLFGLATSALFLLVMGGTAQAGVDQWDFNGNLAATVGSGTLTLEAGGTLTYTTAVIGGRTADVASFPAGAILRMAHGFGANGGGAYVNQYTLIMDVMFPDTTGAGGYASLFQTNTANSNDGDWFLQHNVGVGISGNYGGSVADGVWHRLALVVDGVSGTFTSYVDGAQAMQNTGLTLDGRWSLDPEALLFADNDGEVAAGFLGSVQFRDEALSAAAIAAYGGPTSLGLPPPIVEDFTQADGPPSGWVVTGPTVAVQSGQLVLGPSAAGAELGTILGEGGQALWIDRFARIEAKIAFPGVTAAWPFDHGGVFFCAQTPAGRYGASACYVIDYLAKDGATAEAPGRFRLAKFVGGAEQPLTQTAQTITDYEGLWAIELTDTEIVFSVDGVEQIRYANADLRGGYMGFWAYQVPAENRMTVDDLTVTYAQASCPAFVSSKVALTAGKAPESAVIRIPTGANAASPYLVTVASAEPTVAAPTGHTAGALDVMFDVGDLGVGSVPIEPVGPGETTLGLSIEGADCSGASVPVEVLGLFAFEEHFTQADGPPAGWYIASQSALVVSETLSLKRGTADPFVWYAVQGVPVQVGKMESLSCQIKFARTTNTSIGCHGGMVLAPAVTTARNKGYMIDVIERASDNGYRIYKDNNAGVQLGGPRQPYVWDDQFHEWKITFTPTGFTFSVDGVQKADVQDLTYRGGFLSFWCYTGANQAPQGQNMFVDDISIEFGSSYCPTITPAVAHNWPVNPRTVFTVNAPYGSNFNEDYSLTVTSTQPAVAVPVGAAGGVLVLTYPKGTALAQTFEAECLSPGTTEFVLSAPGAVCPSAKATFTVPEPSEFCEPFDQPDGAPQGWTIHSGAWQVAGKELVVSCAPGGTPTSDTWIWAGSPPVSFGGAATYEFSVNLSQDTPDAVGAHGGFMIFASTATSRGASSGYEIDWISRVDDHGYRCIRYDNGAATVLVGGLNVPLAQGPGNRWKLEVAGADLHFSVDGEHIFTVTDSTYREGYFGFWTYCNTTRAAFDNLAVGLCVFPFQIGIVPNPSFTGNGGQNLPLGTGVVNAPSGVPDFWRAFAVNGNIDLGIVPLASDELFAGCPATNAALLRVNAFGADQGFDDDNGRFPMFPGIEYHAEFYVKSGNADNSNQAFNFGFPIFAGGNYLGREPGGLGGQTATSQWQRVVAPTFKDPQAQEGHISFRCLDDGGENAILLAIPFIEGPATQPIPQVAGDCNQDGRRDISDIVCGVEILFVGFNLLDRTPPVPPCSSPEGNFAVLNVNGDGSLNVSDIIYMANFLFMGGPPPAQGLECFWVPDVLGCPANTGCQ